MNVKNLQHNRRQIYRASIGGAILLHEMNSLRRALLSKVEKFWNKKEEDSLKQISKRSRRS